MPDQHVSNTAAVGLGQLNRFAAQPRPHMDIRGAPTPTTTSYVLDALRRRLTYAKGSVAPAAEDGRSFDRTLIDPSLGVLANRLDSTRRLAVSPYPAVAQGGWTEGVPVPSVSVVEKRTSLSELHID